MIQGTFYVIQYTIPLSAQQLQHHAHSNNFQLVTQFPSLTGKKKVRYQLDHSFIIATTPTTTTSTTANTTATSIPSSSSSVNSTTEFFIDCHDIYAISNSVKHQQYFGFQIILKPLLSSSTSKFPSTPRNAPSPSSPLQKSKSFSLQKSTSNNSKNSNNNDNSSKNQKQVNNVYCVYYFITENEEQHIEWLTCIQYLLDYNHHSLSSSMFSPFSSLLLQSNNNINNNNQSSDHHSIENSEKLKTTIVLPSNNSNRKVTPLVQYNQNQLSNQIHFHTQFIEFCSNTVLNYLDSMNNTNSTIHPSNTSSTSSTPANGTSKRLSLKPTINNRNSVQVNSASNSYVAMSSPHQIILQQQLPQAILFQYYGILQNKIIQWLHMEFEKLEIQINQLKQQSDHCCHQLEITIQQIESNGRPSRKAIQIESSSNSSTNVKNDQFESIEYEATPLSVNNLSALAETEEESSSESIKVEKRSIAIKKEKYHQLIELLVALSANQLQLAKLKQQFILEKSKQILIELMQVVDLENTIYTQMSHQQFIELLTTQFEAQEKVLNIIKQINQLEKECNQLTVVLSQEYLDKLNSLLHTYKQRYSSLQKEHLKILEKLLEKENSPSMQHHQLLNESTEFVVDMQKDLLESKAQLLEKRLSILHIKTDFLQEKVLLFKNKDTDCMVKKNSFPLTPINPRVHYLYLNHRELLKALNREMASHPDNQMLLVSLLVQRLKVHQFFLVEKNMKQLKTKLSSLAGKYSKRLNALICEQNDFNNEKKNLAKILISQKQSSSKAKTEDALSYTKMNLEIIKNEIKLTTYHLEKIEEKISQINNSLMEHKQRKDEVTSSTSVLQLIKLYSIEELELFSSETLEKLSMGSGHSRSNSSLFEQNESSSEEENIYYNICAQRLFEEFIKTVQGDEQTLIIRNDIDKLKDKMHQLSNKVSNEENNESTSPINNEPQDIKSTKSLARHMLSEFITNRDINSVALQQMEHFIKCVSENIHRNQYSLAGISNRRQSVALTPQQQQQQYIDNLYSLENINLFIRHVAQHVLQERADFAAELEENEVYEIIENILFTSHDCKVYNLCIKNCANKEQDNALYNICETKRNYLFWKLLESSNNTKDMTVPDTFIVSFIKKYEEVIKLIQKLSTDTKTPSAKLVLITKASKLIMEVMSKSNSETSEGVQSPVLVAADEFLPIFIANVVVCKNTDLCTQVNFIKMYGNEELLLTSEYAYYAATLESAVYFLLNLENKN